MRRPARPSAVRSTVDRTPPAQPEPTGLGDALGDPDPRELAKVAASPTPGAGEPVSSAVLTVPNLISLTRVALMPVCAWLLASGRFGPGFVLIALVGATDWVDGWLARRTRSVSRLGQLIDPLADRLLIAAVAVALLIRGALPWPVVALLVGRDVVLLAGFQVLLRRGVRPPDVVWLGKAATFVLLLALPALALGETRTVVAGLFRPLGLVLIWSGVALYYAVGWVYARQALAGLRAASRRG